jgi:hypothetical protein
MASTRLLVLCAVAAACSSRVEIAPDGGVAGLPGLQTIVVEPADQVLEISAIFSRTSRYRAVGHFADGRQREITAEVEFSLLDRSLGQFSGDELATGTAKGGRTRVRAVLGPVEGSTGVTMVLTHTYQDPSSSGLPIDLDGVFSGPEDPARAPRVVYPNHGVLVPPNLGKLEFHFYPGPENRVFELHLRNRVTDLRVYFHCRTFVADGCIYEPDSKLWGWLSETNRGGEPVQFSLRGAGASGGSYGVSERQSLAFAYADVDGGVYYWTTSHGSGIMRFDFADPTHSAATWFMGTELTGGTCVGCHALSRDGTKMVAQAGGIDDGRLLLLDVGSRQPMVPFGSTERSVFESWNPDGSRFVGVFADRGARDYNLLVFDGDSGAYLGPIDVGANEQSPTNHPDWSPDGRRIVYTRVGVKGSNQRSYRGAIEMVTESGGAWLGPELVVPAVSGRNRYYPAFSPDGEFIVFNESWCAQGETGDDCDGDSDRSARLFLVRAAPGATPIELTRANEPGIADNGEWQLTNSYPKWNPFVFQRTVEPNTRMAWITVASRRRYGLRSAPDDGTLLWMAAIDLDAATEGRDPSYPALAIPFQDLTTSNHIAQWTKAIVPVD